MLVCEMTRTVPQQERALVLTTLAEERGEDGATISITLPASALGLFPAEG